MIIGTMAAAPVVIAVYLITFDATCASLPEAGFSYMSTVVLSMAVAAVAAVVGVRTIRGLREEAYEAKQLGQYRLRNRLGAGGMGEVYLAEHQLLKRQCAIKLVRPDKAIDAHVLARFEREVQLSAQLSHWNNIEIYDYGHADDGTFYYVMEYLPGMNLHEIVSRFGPMSANRVTHFLSQTCDALGEAHQRGLVHRDIKPANIFAAQRGNRHDVAKLLDFGLAKPMTAGPDSVQLTMEQSITGSPLFMSPEQAIGDHEPDARSDIYSLGAVAYYLLAGQPPFDFEKPIQVLLAHAKDRPTELLTLVPEISPRLNDIIMRCLEKRPEDRFQSVEELHAELAECDSYRKWTWDDADDWWRGVDVDVAVAG